MVSRLKMTPLLMAFLCLATAGCSNVTDQHTSESQHDPQIAILKQLRRVNDDGSYTYGYEAGDGSFKVETRDVLGNIKGTFGFVDAKGEVKRVSYSSANGTGFQSTTVSPLQEHISVAQNIPRHNRTTTTTSTTRKPNLVYASSTESHASSTKSSVVQAIPRTRKPPTTPATTATTTEGPTKPSYIRPKGRHRFVINGQQRPVVLEEEILDEDPTTKTSAENDKVVLRRVIFAKRPLEHSLPPITEEFEDKEEEPKITTGNALRRQLPEQTTKATPVVEIEEDHADVYGGALSTSRPLFTTTNQPRLAPRASALRQERQKVYINQDTGPAKFEQSTRTYEPQESKNNPQEDRNTAQQVLFRTTAQAPEGREYGRGGIDPRLEQLLVRQQQEAYLREVQGRERERGGGLIGPGPGNNLEEDPGLRQIPLGRLIGRPGLDRLIPTQQPLFSGVTDANVHYLADAPPGSGEHEEGVPRFPINPAYLQRQRGPYSRNLNYPELVDPRRPIGPPIIPRPPIPQPSRAQDEQEYQRLAPEPLGYKVNSLELPPEPPNPIAPPLSRRDFQILLRRLLVSQYGIQALNYPRTYLEDALYDQQPYPSYQPVYQAPIPRPEVPYAPEPVGPVPPPPYPERIPLRPRQPMYSRAINPLYQAAGYEDYPEARYSKRVYRQKYYTPEMNEEGEEILPPHIREALLLRMLQLAINSERPIAVPNNMLVTTAAPPRYKNGPVRSVQIIGEDVEDEKEMRKTKM